MPYQRSSRTPTCMMHLSLKDFISEEMGPHLGAFEDVSLRVSSSQLYGLYKDAFEAQAMKDAEEAINEVTKKADEILERILDMIQDPKQRTAEGKKNATEERDGMNKTIENKVGTKMDTVTRKNRYVLVMTKNTLMENKMAQVEELKADEENLGRRRNRSNLERGHIGGSRKGRGG
ncbi:hypothetical protein F4804DRAFT_337748 [Jackrogersella minutella]|nr:hypothetical protein F4804DRAFT_337748 [Jackrogersella minutella]